jgi:succinyl-CoA synthetase beta subunit
LQEWQAKALLSKYDLNLQKSTLISNVSDLNDERVRLEVAKWPVVVVKAQCEAGGRGKGQFVRSGLRGVEVLDNCPSYDQIVCTVKGMLDDRLVTAQTGPDGVQVNKVSVVEGRKTLGEERYLSIVLDGKSKQPMVMVSRHGGVNVEEDHELESMRLFRVDEYRGVAEVLGISCECAGDLLAKLSTVFTESDATMLEINPLSIIAGEEPLIVDAKISIDDNALFRQPHLLQSTNGQAQNYIRLEGPSRYIGCMVNGAGLAMATMDMLQGSACNFLDVGGTATPTTISEAFRLVVSDPRVSTVFVNVFGGIVRGDVVGQGIRLALEEGVLLKRVDRVVVRLAGTRAEEGLQCLRGLDEVVVCKDFNEAARMALARPRAMSLNR